MPDLVCFLETGSYYVTKADLKVMILLPRPLSAGITGIYHHASLLLSFLCSLRAHRTFESPRFMSVWRFQAQNPLHYLWRDHGLSSCLHVAGYCFPSFTFVEVAFLPGKSQLLCFYTTLVSETFTFYFLL
jgi:hypothetical protein